MFESRPRDGVIRSRVDDSLTTWAAETTASGLAAIWATDNTRAALFEAMERRETYATTGPRILVRVFGGWDFEPTDVDRADFAEHGYATGVPMGGDFPSAGAAAGKAPSFVIRAMKEPDGANLDRVQVVKGWMGADGTAKEKVYEVVLADGRTVGANGKAPAIGSTVDVKTATYTNTIGDPMLYGYWRDPEFDAKARAFYYVRVIEIPTPRWTAYDQARFGITMRDDIPMEHQERAYTSAIWYAP